jgi:hypothetical protein
MKEGYDAGFLAGSKRLEMFDGALKQNGYSDDYIKSYIEGFIAGFNSVSLKVNEYKADDDN